MDIQVSNHGSIFLFTPLSATARDWIEENVQPDAQWFAGALAVEHRYAQELAQGMLDAGLLVS